MSRPPGIKQARVKHLVNSLGSIDLSTGNGTVPAPDIFRFEVPAGKLFRWRGMVVTGIAGATFTMNTFVGAAALASGLRVVVLDAQDAVVEDFATGDSSEKRAIKRNADWLGLTPSVQILAHGSGSQLAVAMEMEQYFEEGVVDLLAGRSVAILVRDNLTGLSISRVTATAFGRMLDA